jgi:signal transduction histidine kinase
VQRPLGVLIVEDSEDDALLVARELRRGGYDVTAERVDTADGMRAALARGGWDAVIADYSLPQFSGLAALQVLKDSGLDLPFILVSGAIGEDVAVEAMRCGAHDYFMKGKLARLAAAVERELREAEVRGRRRQAEEDLRRAHEELEQRVEERTRELARTNDDLRRATAEAKRANQAKDEFLGVLSHELRTPLAHVLLASSSLAKRRDLPADVQAEVQDMRRNIELEARIIDDLLDVTRIARGKLLFKFKTADLHESVRQAADLCGHGAGAKVELRLAAKSHFVHGDAARLQQVFWNLLNNARKFTPPDGHIQVGSSQTPEGRIQVQVSDTGVGIAAQSLERIFAAFEQGSRDTARQFGGLGLGLAICKAIVVAHGGTISAASAGKGHGATFTVQLPVLERTTRPARPRPTEEARGAARPGLRVLVVEDDPSMRRILARVIPDMGYEVQTVGAIEAAVEVVQRERFDIMISDLRLPDGNGCELMRRLRATSDLRAIALSGSGLEEDVRRSLEAGFTEHLTKPIDLETLEAAIQRVVEAGETGRTPGSPRNSS